MLVPVDRMFYPGDTMALIFNALYLIVFLTGLHAFFYIIGLRKKGLDFALPYASFILCWNLLILETFAFGYLKAGVLNTTRFDTWQSVLVIGDGLFRILAVFGSLYFFVKVLSSFSGKGIRQKLKIFFSAAFIAMSFLSGFAAGTALFDSNYMWITQIQDYSVKAGLFLLLFFTIVYNQKNKLLPDTADRNRAVTFGKFYSTAFFVFSAVFILSLWNLFSYLLVVLMYLLMNIFPPVWYRISLLDAELEGEASLYVQIMGRIRKEYGLTPREEEVCQLLLEGLDNQEIQESLHISVSTVKNYVYKIFKKLGIRDREDLMRFFDTQSGGPAEKVKEEPPSER